MQYKTEVPKVEKLNNGDISFNPIQEDFKSPGNDSPRFINKDGT